MESQTTLASTNTILKEMEMNKALFDSRFGAPEDKINAFRRQSLLLDQITEQTMDSDSNSFVMQQAKLRDDAEFKAYVQERHFNANNYLSGLPPRNISASSSAADLRAGRISALEDEIVKSGKYKALIKDKVSDNDLSLFRKILGKVPSISTLQRPSIRHQLDSQEFINPQPSVEPSSSRRGSKMPAFRTAREELAIQNAKRNSAPDAPSALFNYGASRRSLGSRRSVRSSFVPPIRPEDQAPRRTSVPTINEVVYEEPVDERLQNIDPKMIELIRNEIMHKFKPVAWDDIAGLDYAKSTIKEAVVWPLLRPDIFTGLRRPPRGILLFGPPGTGKTLIGKCIASQSKSTFFSISASSLTSKWVGDGEKMVRALFAVAAVHQPSVVFIDEIDSLLSQRSDTEHESSRRIKTEFLVQLDGAATSVEDRILVIGATNRPQELDEAARRRLVRRLYIPLPEQQARAQILTRLLQTVTNTLSEAQIEEVAKLTNGYSGADMETLCREASMEPIRSIPPDDIPIFNEEEVRPVTMSDFGAALQRVLSSVSQDDLKAYVDWNKTYGAG